MRRMLDWGGVWSSAWCGTGEQPTSGRTLWGPRRSCASTAHPDCRCSSWPAWITTLPWPSSWADSLLLDRCSFLLLCHKLHAAVTSDGLSALMLAALSPDQVLPVGLSHLVHASRQIFLQRAHALQIVRSFLFHVQVEAKQPARAAPASESAAEAEEGANSDGGKGADILVKHTLQGDSSASLGAQRGVSLDTSRAEALKGLAFLVDPPKGVAVRLLTGVRSPISTSSSLEQRTASSDPVHTSHSCTGLSSKLLKCTVLPAFLMQAESIHDKNLIRNYITIATFITRFPTGLCESLARRGCKSFLALTTVYILCCSRRRLSLSGSTAGRRRARRCGCWRWCGGPRGIPSWAPSRRWTRLCTCTSCTSPNSSTAAPSASPPPPCAASTLRCHPLLFINVLQEFTNCLGVEVGARHKQCDCSDELALRLAHLRKFKKGPERGWGVIHVTMAPSRPAGITSIDTELILFPPVLGNIFVQETLNAHLSFCRCCGPWRGARGRRCGGGSTSCAWWTCWCASSAWSTRPRCRRASRPQPAASPPPPLRAPTSCLRPPAQPLLKVGAAPLCIHAPPLSLPILIIPWSLHCLGGLRGHQQTLLLPKHALHTWLGQQCSDGFLMSSPIFLLHGSVCYALCRRCSERAEQPVPEQGRAGL